MMMTDKGNMAVYPNGSGGLYQAVIDSGVITKE